ncbi:MAG: hypothetical protein NC110_06105 [Ruminococcus sp.]|nr:hypothetical protein [Ruminococcus sp.]
MAIRQIKAIIRGKEEILTYNATSGYYEATVPAPSDSSFNEQGGYFPVKVIAVDTAGNESVIDSTDSTFGANLRLFNKEIQKPVIEILSPTTGAYITNSRPEIKFKITDNKLQTSGWSGVNKNSCNVKINGRLIADFDGGVDISWEETEGGFIGTVNLTVDIPDSENVTISVDCRDNDGNAADTATVVFAIDTLAPQLTIVSPADDLETNQDSILVSVTTEPGVSVTVKLNGAAQGTPLIADENGHAERTVKLTKQGENIIEVFATDAAGLSSPTCTRTIVFNTTAPVFEVVKMEANGRQITQSNPAAAGGTYKIMVKMRE